MKPYVAVFVMAFMSASGAAYSQGYPQGYPQDMTAQPPIRPEDIGKYCIYASKIYSQGSQLCVVRGGVTLGCDKGEWKVDLTKYGLDCRNENSPRPAEQR